MNFHGLYSVGSCYLKNSSYQASQSIIIYFKAFKEPAYWTSLRTDWTTLMQYVPLSIHTLRILQYYSLEDTWVQLFNTCNESTTKIRFLNLCTSLISLAIQYPASAQATAIYGCFDWSRSSRGFFITVYTVLGFCMTGKKIIHFGDFKDFEWHQFLLVYCRIKSTSNLFIQNSNCYLRIYQNATVFSRI